MFEVKGFAFETEQEAKAAEKEAEDIRYIKAQTKMDDPDVVLKLYTELLQRKHFTTPVGIAFMLELQEYLHTIPYVKNEDIWPIPVRNGKNRGTLEKKPKPAPRTKSTQGKSYRGAFRCTLLLSIILFGIVLGMFTITFYSKDNVNILNYENSIINKYESWEKDLSEREAILKEREAALENED